MKPNLNPLKVLLLIGIAIPWTVACSSNSGSGNVQVKTMPAIQTVSVNYVMYTSAKVKSLLGSDGGSAILRKGICWSVNANPAISDSVVAVSGSEQLYTCQLKNLQMNTTYHVRAFATNEVGTNYGQDMTFKTVANDSLPTEVEPLLTTVWNVFTWPMNYYYPDYQGQNNINGKYPAPCGPTTLARTLAYWKGRIHGTGMLDAMNTTNEVRFCLNLDTLSIDYDNLPNVVKGISLRDYRDVAKLFLLAGAVSLTNFVDVATPGDAYIAGLKQYMTVSSGVHFAKRWEYAKADWIKLLKTELAHGRPLMIAARTSTSPTPWGSGNVAGHWFNIEGYNSQNQFYINYNYGGSGFKGYYDVDNFGEYNSYGLVVIGFEPK